MSTRRVLRRAGAYYDEAGQNLARVSVKHRSYIEKLNDIETPLSALVLGHEGLRTAKLFGHLLLGQAFCLA